MPEILVVTPESLHFASKKSKTKFLKIYKCVAVDEWYELLSSKRGVMVELALSILRSISKNFEKFGINRHHRGI